MSYCDCKFRNAFGKNECGLRRALFCIAIHETWFSSRAPFFILLINRSFAYNGRLCSTRIENYIHHTLLFNVKKVVCRLNENVFVTQ